MLHIHFGEPLAGWLPVWLEAEALHLEFYASAIPTDPLAALGEALILCLSGLDTQTRWELEPAVYTFDFTWAGPDTLVFTVAEKADWSKPNQPVGRLTGSAAALVGPFHRALAAFAARQYPAAHWPALRTSTLSTMADLLARPRR